MSKEVSKSPEMLQKEAKIKELQTNLKKRKSILKGLKTRLENSKKEIEEVQFKSSTQIVGIMERMEELRLEIVELARKLKKLKTLTKEDKMALGMMADELESEDLLPDDYKEFQRRRKEMKEGNFEFDFEEQERAKIQDIFKEFQVKPDEKEQKDIRKVFVKLANKFHPDRARTEKEAAEFHEMQQRLNEAYQSGDIHTLLELERLYLMEELDLSEAKAYTADVLQQAIEKLEQELAFIENQINRYQQEIKSLRASDFGSMLTHLKRAKKEGFGFEDSLADMEGSVEQLTQLRDAMKESLEMGELSPSMMDLAYGGPMSDTPFGPIDPNMSPEEALEYLDQMFNGGKGDLFEQMSAYSAEATKKAKYKVGDTLKIKKAIRHPYEEEVLLKGMIGRVEFIDFDEQGLIQYELSLDSLAMKALPKKLIEHCNDLDLDFQEVHVLEKEVEKCKSRDTQAESIATYRTLYNQNKWNYLPKDQEKRLLQILLADPALNDSKNWENHLRNKVKYPFEAISRGTLDNPPGISMTVKGVSHDDDELGLMMKVKSGKQHLAYPLSDIEGLGKQRHINQLLDDYSEWYEDMIDTMDGFLNQDFFF